MFFFQNIVLSLEDRDAEELILVLCGYHKLLTERELDVIQDTAILQQQEEEQQQQGTYIFLESVSKKIVLTFELLDRLGRSSCNIVLMVFFILDSDC